VLGDQQVLQGLAVAVDQERLHSAHAEAGVVVAVAVVGVAPVALQIRVIPETLAIPVLLHHTILYL